jgi:carbonic anhydrase
MIFDLGDLFIIRTAGKYRSCILMVVWSLLFLKLKTKLIVVLGHTECGVLLQP